MEPHFSVAGKVAIVTGGSKGIGKGIARVLAAARARVLVVARGEAQGAQAVAEITQAGGEASFFAADVSHWPEVEAMAGAAVDRYGRIDILCSNAGIFPSADIADLSEESWNAVVDLNLKGTFFAVKACAGHMKKAGSGRIVLTSSITGPITGYPGWAHYGATKAGMLGFMRTAVLELAPFGITINAVLPGNIRTEGLADLGQEYLERMQRAIPVGKLGEVEDVGHAVLFLATEEARFITGQTLVIDGGQTLPESLDALT